MHETMEDDSDAIQGELNFNDSNEDGSKSKEIRVEKERQELLARVVSGQIENIRDRVAYILNYSNEARNSDIELAWLFWETFERDKFSGSMISKEQMKEMARIPSLSRIR